MPYTLKNKGYALNRFPDAGAQLAYLVSIREKGAYVLRYDIQFDGIHPGARPTTTTISFDTNEEMVDELPRS